MKQTPLAAIALVASLGLTACSPKPDASSDTGTATPSSSAAPEMEKDTGMAGMPGMGNMAMTGDPDRDFLRMMSDHHKGLIALVHATVESKQKLTVRPIAKQLDAEQDADLDKMSTMLEKTFKDPYAPKIMPEHQAMVDELKTKTGANYDRTFLQDVVKHHQEAIPMIDAYLPKAKNAKVKAMAEKMKAMQTKQISDYQKKLAASGGG